jgi:hypothetical protein
MKKITFSSMLLVFVLATGTGLTSCKNKAKDTTTTTTTVDTPATNLPVEVNSDDALRKGVTDATKDYPGVTATVNDGVIILSGTIERDRWTKLNQTLQSLNPKRVNADSLTIKK